MCLPFIWILRIVERGLEETCYEVGDSPVWKASFSFEVNGTANCSLVSA